MNQKEHKALKYKLSLIQERTGCYSHLLVHILKEIKIKFIFLCSILPSYGNTQGKYQEKV